MKKLLKTKQNYSGISVNQSFQLIRQLVYTAKETHPYRHSIAIKKCWETLCETYKPTKR